MSSMRLNLIMGLIDKITGPIQKVTSETDRMGERVKKTQDALNQLGNNAKDIEHLRDLQERSGRTGSALQEAQAKARALALEMKATADPTQKLSAAFDRATSQVRRLQEQQQAERLELQQTTGRLKEAGVSTQRLDEATRRIAVETKRYNEQLAKEQKALDRVAEKQKHLADIKQRNSDMKMDAMGDALGVGAAILGAKKLVDAYGEVVTARNDGLALGLDQAGIDSITAKAKAFSDMWSGTTQAEFISGAVEIKSAIDTLGAEAIGDFTKIAALVAKSTKSTTGEMTSLMATGYGVYRRQFDQFGKAVVSGWDKMSQEERDIKFGEYFAAGLVECVNVFKSDGQQMSAALTNLGATATSANVPFAEQLAILGQLQLTMSGSEAATKYRAFIGAAGGAAKKLGLDFTDANDNLKSMPEILEELKDKFGDTLDAIETQKMKEAFGTDEAIALIQLLYPEVDSLKKNIGGMQEALKGGMSTTQRMAEIMNSGPNEAFKLMSQRVQNASVSIGEKLAPALTLAANLIGTLAQFAGALTDRFPFLSQVLAFAAVGLVGLKVASIAARLSFAFFSDAVMLAGKTLSSFTLTNLRAQAVLLMTRIRTLAAAAALLVFGSVARIFAVGAALMTAAQWALNAAMLANPIGLVILAIMALVAVVAVVTRYWAPLAAFFGELWGRIKAVFSEAWTFIKALLLWAAIEVIVQVWQPLTAFFGGLWTRIKAVFSEAWTFIKALLLWAAVEVIAPLWQPLTAFFGGLWTRIKAVFSEAWTFIKAVFSAAWDFIKALLMWTPLGLIVQLWQPLTAFFDGIWSGIKAVFSSAWGFIKALMNFAFVWSVYLVWQPLVTFFSELWTRIKAVFSEAWTFIKALLMWAAIEVIVQAWQPLTAFFGGLWTRIKAVFSDAWTFIKALLMWAALEVIAPLWQPLMAFFGSLWSGIKIVFSSAWEVIKTLLMWTPFGLIIQAWEPLTEYFGGLWERIKGVFASATSWLTDSVLAPVRAIMDTISGLFGEGVVTVTQKIDAATAAVNGALPPSADGASHVAGPGVPAAAPAGGVASPAGRAAAPQQVNQYGGIVVQAAPGMSEEQVAKKVRAELDARDRAAANKQRGRLGD